MLCHCYQQWREQAFQVIVAGSKKKPLKNIVHVVKDGTQVDLLKKAIKNISEVYIYRTIAWLDSLYKFQ